MGTSHQGFAVLVDEVLAGARPLGQHHVAHLLVGKLQAAQVEACRQSRQGVKNTNPRHAPMGAVPTVGMMGAPYRSGSPRTRGSRRTQG